MRPPRVLRRRRVVAVLASLLLAALCVLAFGGCAADHLVLGQSRETINPATLRRELVEYPHGTVECWVARSPGAASREPRAYVLFFVGKSDRAERWTAAVAGASGDRPVEAWGMNHPGSGGSTGPPRLARVAPAALATYDRMQHQASGRPVAVASLPQSEILAAVGHAAAGARAAWTVAAIANRAPHLRDMDLSARHGPAPPPQGGRSTPRRS